MASVRYSRIDGRRPFNYCLIVTIVGFVAFSLLAVWMYMSPTIAPIQNSDVSLQEDTTDLNKKSNENNFTTSQDATKRYGDTGGSPGENKEVAVGNAKVDETNNDKTDQEEIISEKSDREKVGPDNNKETIEKSPTEIKDDQEGKSVGYETKRDSGKNISEETTMDGASDSPTGDTEIESGSSETDTKSSAKPADVGKGKKEVENISDEGNRNTAQHVGEDNVPSGDNAEIFNESRMQNGSWSTQSQESQNEKSQQDSLSKNKKHDWKICNTSAGPDYIPCLDNWYAMRRLPTTAHYEHRERHCPSEAPTCLVPLPKGYKEPIKWPKSREKIWFANVPHTKLVQFKGSQNWVKFDGDYLTFPGGGTQFVHGAGRYISYIEEVHPSIAWGERSRVILDVGCGVASFGGFLFDRDVLTMSFAPKDEHEAQVQFALERGIPAILEVMGTQRLPFPGGVFDAVHCARCRVPWHVDGGKLLLELNRVLRPGGFFVWSATPIYRKDPENVGIWQAMSRLTKSMCWDLVVVKRDQKNKLAAAIYRKPTSNDCYERRPKKEPPLCKESDDQNAAWKVPMQVCMHKVPENMSERGSVWPEQWPLRLEKPPYWLNSKVGVYGKAGPDDFSSDYEHWKNVFSKSYLNGLGINWSDVRNVMDMRAVYGGFAAALRDLPVWVMNIVPIDSPDTLPIIYERGLFGLYHDWCESFNTYPRSYDLLHADHLFSNLKKRCNLVPVIAEVDRILRPEGKLIVRDNAKTIMQVESIVTSLQWEIKHDYTRDNEGLLCVQKAPWRPSTFETISSAFY